MKSSSNTSDRFSIYEAITNQIIAAIESGTGDVQMPWHQSGGSIQRPINVQQGAPIAVSTP